MRNYLIAGAMLAMSATAAPAVTLNYVGENYSSASGGNAPGCVFGCVGTIRLKGYDRSMRLEFSLELDNALRSNERFRFNSGDLISYEIFDGLYKRTDENPGHDPFFNGVIQTNYAGEVTSWDFSFFNGSAQDSDILRSTTNGDYVRHTREYQASSDFEIGTISGFSFAASTDAPGTWYYGTPPANIPLPASLPLLLAGFGAFGILRRRARKAP